MLKSKNISKYYTLHYLVGYCFVHFSNRTQVTAVASFLYYFLYIAVTMHQKVRRFSIDMEYKHEFKSTIYTRIHFSVKRLVEEFHFTMYKDDLCRDYPLELPLYFY